MTFSKRHGIVETMPLQKDSLNKELRTGLWNMYFRFVHNHFATYPNDYWENETKYIGERLWVLFFKLEIDNFSIKTNTFKEVVKSFIYEKEWFLVYDLIEELVDSLKIHNEEWCYTYTKACNNILESENSAYRIIGNLVTPIINETEISEIEIALRGKNNSSVHISSAIEKLSDKQNPDYRNSIKESISAVESVCREITGENTLGYALRKLSKSIEINEQFKEGLQKFYNFSNSKESGIRHSILDKPSQLTFDDAKFFLVMCSAFVNYLESLRNQFNQLKG